MFEMLDAFIGLMFVYLILSLIVTTGMQFWVDMRGLRGRNLRETLSRLFLEAQGDGQGNDQDGDRDNSLLTLFYAHPRVLALKRSDKNDPSYIPQEVFIEVLMDLVTQRVTKRDNIGFAKFRHSPHKIERILEHFEHQEQGGKYAMLAKTLKTFWVDSGAEVEQFHTRMDTWFSQTQERASGWFKRTLSVRLFVIGLLVAVVTNADTLHMFKILTGNDTLRDAYVQKALSVSAQEDFTALSEARCAQAANPESLECSQLAMAKQAAGEIAPLLGWDETTQQRFLKLEDWAEIISSVVGWILTAVALSLGAPFWFDMLQKVVRIRSSLRPAPAGGAPQGEEVPATEVRGGMMTVQAVPGKPAFDEDDFKQFQPGANRYNITNAFWMVRFSELAYQDEKVLQARCEDWELEAEAHSITTDKVDTQCFLAYDKNTLVIAFRGTEANNMADVRTDADFQLVPCLWNERFQVHRGFQRALDAIWPDLVERIAKLHKNRYVWITGHSLGGALAMLAAHRLLCEERQNPGLKGIKIGGLYTSGQPRCADREFAEDLEHNLGSRICRIVNNRDVVPLVPPPVGGYAHAGSTLYITETGRLMFDPPLWYRVLDKVEVVTDKDKLSQSLKETVGDHSAGLYVRLIAGELKTSV